nr:aldehyde dehydrogenase family protein [Achromobacter marplatensis]
MGRVRGWRRTCYAQSALGRTQTTVISEEEVLAAEAAPFGGVKESGYGREGSRHGLQEYTHIKYLCQGGLG